MFNLNAILVHAQTPTRLHTCTNTSEVRPVCRNIILVENGALLTPTGAKINNNLCNDFDLYWSIVACEIGFVTFRLEIKLARRRLSGSPAYVQGV